MEKLIKRKRFFIKKILNFFNFLVYSCTFLATKHSQTIHQSENPNQNKIRTWFKVGVSNKTVTRPTHPIPSDPARRPANPTPVKVSGKSRPLEPENGGSVGGFSLQNPKIPDRIENSAFLGEVFQIHVRSQPFPMSSQLDPWSLHRIWRDLSQT